MSDSDGWHFDPVERTDQYKRVIAEVEELAEAEFERRTGYSRESLGACHRFWQIKKGLLLELHGIEWQTPSELNPGVLFD